MSFNWRDYNREYQRQHRAKLHRQKLLSQGKCPITEMLLVSQYHDSNCPCGIRLVNFLTIQEVTIYIHEIEPDKPSQS